MGGFRFACHVVQFGDDRFTNRERVLREVAEAGWEGAEGLQLNSADELVVMATLARGFGLHLVNVRGPSGMETARYNIALGNSAAEVAMLERSEWGGESPGDDDFERAARSLDGLLTFCREHRLKGVHHAHMGTMIETVLDAERLLAAAPDLWLLYDTGHLLACGSDPKQVFRSDRLRCRIGHVHLKDLYAQDPATWNHHTQAIDESARFASLGSGNMGLDVKAVLEELGKVGYEGWVTVEQDGRYYPARPPSEAARANREYLRRLGY